MTVKLLRLKTVQEWTGLSRSSIYALQAIGKFPPSISIGARAVAWSSSDIEAWISTQISNSKKSCPNGIKEAV